MHNTRIYSYFCSTDEPVVARIEFLDDGGSGFEKVGKDVFLREGTSVVGEG